MTNVIKQDEMDIQQIANRQFNWVERMGWHNKTRLGYLALVCSEVGEAINECRGEVPTDNYPEELADILLRTLDLMRGEGIDITQTIRDKMNKNEANGTRGKLY